MHGRLAAPPASLGCLNLAKIKALESNDRLIDLDGADWPEQLAELRDFIRDALEKADERLAEQFWDGGDVVQLLSLIHISEPTRRATISRMPSSA